MAIGNNWVICREESRSAELTLFCFPHAGGGASTFRGWQERLPSEIEVCWIQLPGRENRRREKPLSSMQELVSSLTEGLARSADRPFAFYGHSLGAKVAFETARALRRRGQLQPCHLFVGASNAPQVVWDAPPMHQLPEEQFIEEVQKRYGGVPPEVVADAELRALLIPTLRADVQLVETYRYTPDLPLHCPITAFAGASDQTVGSGVEAWASQTRGGFRLHRIAGGHFFIHSAQRELLNLIASELKAILHRQ